ncbi:hypothetical protein VNO77_36706 [Canavalia gladiata]|uniref:Uncharacterized protein n=1 Tax=Canavalia gladiata TaxID=3824 RepID=A0AAN9PWR3_CANGL
MNQRLEPTFSFHQSVILLALSAMLKLRRFLYNLVMDDVRNPLWTDLRNIPGEIRVKELCALNTALISCPNPHVNLTNPGLSGNSNSITQFSPPCPRVITPPPPTTTSASTKVSNRTTTRPGNEVVPPPLPPLW